MFKNYFKIAIRNLLKHKGYNSINVAGLAIGMACCLFILLYVRHELSYDRFHKNGDRIFRVTSELQSESRPSQPVAVTPIPLAPALLKDYPAIEQAIRLRLVDFHVKYENSNFYEDRFIFTDPAFFDVFTFALGEGDPQTALAEPFSVVLTQATARKYFGDRNPIGEMLVVDDSLQFNITSVLVPLPQNSHFDFDFLASFETIYPGSPVNMYPQYPWWTFDYYTYVLLKDNASFTVLANQIHNLGDRYVPEQQTQYGTQQRYFLQPLTEIYLHSNLLSEIDQTSNIIYIYIFLGIATLVLIIAGINFVNLSTARSLQRAREIGMRKTLGAFRSQLVQQLLGESCLIAFVALILAIIAIELFLPAFNQLTGKALELNIFQDFTTAFGLIGIALLVGVVAGSYPALVLSNFAPVKTLAGVVSKGQKGALLRRALVVFQFAASIILIIGTIVVYRQLDFMRNQNLGFNQEQVVVIPIRDNAEVKARFEEIKNELLQLPGILNASASSSVPGRTLSSIVFYPEGADESQTQGINTLTTDYDFVETFDLQLAAGRNFSREFATDPAEAFIINEATVARLGWGTPEHAIGRQITWGWPGKKGRVIGVVDDFHYVSLQHRVESMIMHIQPSWFDYLSVKIAANDIRATIAELETTWQQLVPNRPFDYYFLDENFNRQYRAEERLGNLFMLFSALAIFIACLGLFGLAAFTAEQRTKEIGVRKVLGATIPSVAGLLSKDFLKLVALANLIAWPLAWFAMNRWLQDFAYRTEMNWWVFVLAGTMALIIALLTVSTQAIKAALVNPVDSLKYE